MKQKRCIDLHFRIEDGKYINEERIVYYSSRYKKTITIEPGFESDGATGGEDLVSLSWLVHDKVCVTHKWDDGSYCDSAQRSWILHDILKSEGRWFRCKSWGFFSYLFQKVLYWREESKFKLRS